MEGSLIVILTSICSLIISLVTVWGLVIKFSDKLFRKLLCKGLDSIDLRDLDPDSDMAKVLSNSSKLITEYPELRRNLENDYETLSELTKSITQISKDLEDMKKSRFKSDLRSRLEYAITKKGRINAIYWDHIVEDFNYYTNVLKMNTYMGSLYKEAEALYINNNVKNGEK